MENTSPNLMTVPNNLREAIIYFADLQVCHDFMTAIRWQGNVCCPRCGDTAVGFVKTRRIWNCKGCKKQFSVKVGTIFEDSPLGLDKWLPAFWLIVNAKNGISSCELARSLDVTQKTAWFMLHRIRLAIKQGSFEKMSGTVEADETFVGGKAKNMHKDKREKTIKGRGATGKTIVMGLLERAEEEGKVSKVRTNVIPNTGKETIEAEVRANVEPGSDLNTDALKSYQGLGEDYAHQFVDHAIKYAIGMVHTNGLENYWSLVKRMLKGTYVSVEPEHLLAYLDEEGFRFNERDMKDAGRFVKALGGAKGKRLTYQMLIGNPQGIDSPDPLRGGPRAD
jgi:transposase-like protein